MKQTFTCNAAQFQSLKAQLIAEGVAVPDGNSGTIDSGMGFKISYDWNGADSLDATVISKTCWLPTTTQIFDQLQAHLNA